MGHDGSPCRGYARPARPPDTVARATHRPASAVMVHSRVHRSGEGRCRVGPVPWTACTRGPHRPPPDQHQTPCAARPSSPRSTSSTAAPRNASSASPASPARRSASRAPSSTSRAPTSHHQVAAERRRVRPDHPAAGHLLRPHARPGRTGGRTGRPRRRPVRGHADGGRGPERPLLRGRPAPRRRRRRQGRHALPRRPAAPHARGRRPGAARGTRRLGGARTRHRRRRGPAPRCPRRVAADAGDGARLPDRRHVRPARSGLR